MVKNSKNQWTIRGIVSVAKFDVDGLCDVNEYLGFTDIGKFLNWIYSKMRSDSIIHNINNLEKTYTLSQNF